MNDLKLQSKIIEVLSQVQIEGKLGLTTRQLSQRLNTYYAKTLLNAALLEERGKIKTLKKGKSIIWYIQK